MSYQSPIEVIQTQLRNQIEGEIYKAVMNVGVNVDKEELLKALQYDREQYQKGYKDRDDQIVRCRDCKHRSEEMYDYYNNPYDKRYVCQIHDIAGKADWFCPDGERKET